MKKESTSVQKRTRKKKEENKVSVSNRVLEQVKTEEYKSKKTSFDNWIDEYSFVFERYISYSEANNWVFEDNRYETYNTHIVIVKTILSNIKEYNKNFGGYLELNKSKKFVEKAKKTVDLFLERCSYYIRTNDWIYIQDEDAKRDEIDFHNKLLNDQTAISKQKSDLFKEDENLNVNVPVFGDRLTPFLMKDIMETKHPEIITYQENLTKMKEEENRAMGIMATDSSILRSNTEMFVNMKEKDIPKWDRNKHYYEQDKDVLQFFEEERQKIIHGVNIGGYFVHGWLYWHLNYFKTDIPAEMLKGRKDYNPNKQRIVTNPILRDNELFFAECYQEADEKNVGLFMFGTRRFGKALANYEYVLTDKGKEQISLLKVGDKVYNRKGKLCNVVGVFPQGKRPVYNFVLEDLREVDCDLEHLWSARINGIDVICTTNEIIGALDMGYFVHIPLNKSVDFNRGVNKSNPMQCAYSYLRNNYKKTQIADNIKYADIPFRKQFAKHIIDKLKIRDNNPYYSDVERLYLHSEEVWKELLFIFRSVGLKCYSSRVSDRKFEILILNIENLGSEAEEVDYYVGVKRVDYVGEIDATCIKVDDEEELFLTEDFIVTHNTVLESSVLTWRTTVLENSESFVFGGNDGDLQKLSKTIEIAFTNVHPAFYLERNNNDWTSHIQFGLRSKSGVRIPYSDVFIRNVNSGTMDGALKGAGGTPTAWILDEAGKFMIKKLYGQAIPSFGNPMGWAVVPLLTGTGGEAKLSLDAQEMLTNPEANRILPMNWDRLEKYVDEKDMITWERRVFGTFVPAHFSFKEGIIKKKTTLGDFLKIDNEELKRTELEVTNWSLANEIIKRDRDLYKNKPVDLNEEKMAFPINTLECFLQTEDNPFPAKDILEHIEYLESIGDTGRKCDVIYYNGKEDDIRFVDSNKDLAPYPYSSGVVNAPILVFEEPEFNDMNNIYVAGLDHYKHDKSNTNSLGALYIYKRNVSLGDYRDTIVCSYVARPEYIDIFNENCEAILEAYGAQCLQEGADVTLQIHLRSKNKEYKLLAEGFKATQKYTTQKTIQLNKLSFPTNKQNQQLVYNMVITYANEPIVVGVDENGVDIVKKGITRIKDIGLLKEMLNFEYGKNCDRIIAFGHALVWKQYLDDMNILPRKNVVRDENVYKKKIKNTSGLRFYKGSVYGDIKRGSRNNI